MSNRIATRCLIEENDAFRIALVEMECLGGRVSEINKINNLDKECSGVLLSSFFNIHSYLGEGLFRHIEGADWTISKYLGYTEKYNDQLTKEQEADCWIESARFWHKRCGDKGLQDFVSVHDGYLLTIFYRPKEDD